MGLFSRAGNWVRLTRQESRKPVKHKLYYIQGAEIMVQILIKKDARVKKMPSGSHSHRCTPHRHTQKSNSFFPLHLPTTYVQKVLTNLGSSDYKSLTEHSSQQSCACILEPFCFLPHRIWKHTGPEEMRWSQPTCHHKHQPIFTPA